MSLFFDEFLAPMAAHGGGVIPGRAFLRERKEVTASGEEDLLSVSEYSGVTRRRDNIEDGDFVSRAESLDGYRVVRRGDLVVNYMLAWKGALGISALDGITSPAYAVFELDPTKVYPRFAHALLRSELFKAYFRTESTGIIDSRLRLYPESLLSLRMVLPPISEQRLVADFLDRETARIDALIEKKTRFIELLREKRRALVMSAVVAGLDPRSELRASGMAWLGDVPSHWRVVPLKWLVAVGNGSTPSRENPRYWRDGRFPWLTSSVVNEEEVTEAQEFVTSSALKECHLPVVSPPAVLIGLTGQGRTRGLASTLRLEATISQHLAFVKPFTSALDVDYLRRFLDVAYRHLRNDSDGGGSTKGAITCEQLRDLACLVPPLNEQRAIVARIRSSTTRLEALLARTEASIGLLHERRAALITAAVTGQIDVRAEQPAEDLEPA